MKMLFCFTIFLVSVNLYSQKNYTSFGNVSYNFSHQRDTASNKTYKETMMLSFNKDISEYKSYTKMISDSLLKLQISNAIKEQGSDNINLGKLTVRGTTDKYFYQKDKNQLIYIKPLKNVNYMIIDSFCKINWIVIDSFKNIGGYNCQKATANFRGRNYCAWFAQELPFPYGPWKLQGLPGLILEASDLKGQVVFQFSSINIKNILSSNEISFPKQTVATTERELEATIKAFRDGAKNDANSESIQISSTNNGKTILRKIVPINNPLELLNN